MQPGSSFVVPEALGVVLIISPWNYPISLLLLPLIGAIAAGNCAVLKPSEIAATTSQVVARIVGKYMDSACCVVVEGGVAETTHLLQLPFDHVFYTGNGKVGKIIMKAAAEHLTPVTLELGGKSPVIVDPTCDLTVTCKRLVWGKFLNCGQTCLAPDYVMVHRSITQKFLDTMVETVRSFYSEDPYSSQDYSRIINGQHVSRLSKLLQRAIDGGDVIMCGGTVLPKDKYIAPTIVRLLTADSPLMEDELFGPILPVLEVNSFQEALQFVRARDKPLAAYLFSGDNSQHKEFLENISAGGVCINDVVVQCSNPELPFGGVGASGMGKYHGQYSFDAMSHHKAVLSRPFLLDVDIRYPPYTPTKIAELTFVRNLRVSPTKLALSVGVVAVAGVSIFLGLTDIGRSQIQGAKSLLISALESTANLLKD
eukprot:TRINITY_DN834_c0_g1_i1.p1 TRINITY_DN834_c0_g1~~TRINITY_DN834_c0_g1_i1.p1  ORF type:complete len:425 (+),score=84.74 TRINITY_DN834_c0_g1_i1:331-1605(+)